MAHQGNSNQPRQDYLKWEDYFMGLAGLAAMRSKDPVTQVGACIVGPDNSIVSVGYNGMPNGDDKSFSWGKGFENNLENKHLFVCHAERNALNYARANSTDLKLCTMYVILYPCNECAKAIAQAGIKKVVYYSNKHEKKVETIAARRIFENLGISIEPYTTPNKIIVIDLDKINRT
ncbi:hypothetical protein GWI33_011155 [Rhynchophorus ferrugineus]|uniref:Probable deoxycytidylate deaminase n=1 Tax=Rhynchophorus ferrugineus TaxID=354439 RepID=A0A834I8H6_RHYFE|nr:hypothetical protein GWI33_011155 [Rhynchophorus ferrugineus]